MEHKMIEQKFVDERKLIGQGREANVYLWNGYAYKCFNSNYPKDLIEYEFNLQNTIYSTGLPTVKYYESEIPHSIKMDYIDGVHIGEKYFDRSYKDGVYNIPDLSGNEVQRLRQNYEKVLNIMLSLSTRIHSIKESDIKSASEKINDFSIPYLNPTLIKRINSIDIEDSRKQLAIKFISEIEDKKALCHMDYHFFNIMCSDDKYLVIDWMDSKLGNPIYDYARSYIILYEFVSEFDELYLEAVKNQYDVDEADLKKAIYVMAVHRLAETNSNKLRDFINSYKL